MRDSRSNFRLAFESQVEMDCGWDLQVQNRSFDVFYDQKHAILGWTTCHCVQKVSEEVLWAMYDVSNGGVMAMKR